MTDKPYVRFLHGDCRSVMDADAPYDMILADPPYGDTSLAWDRRVIGWERIAAAAIKPTGSMWLFGSMRSLCMGWPALEDAGWQYAQDVVWEKHNGSSFHADRFKRVHEHIVQFYRKDSVWASVYNDVQTTPDATARTTRRKKRPAHTGNIGAGAYESNDGGPRLMRSVLPIPSCHGIAIHPTEKPVALLEILIRTSCPPEGVVGDFFAGSGAAADAAAMTGRSYVGAETCAKMLTKASSRSLFVV